MSLRPLPLRLVPEDTARVARTAFPKGNPYLRLRDSLGSIFTDEAFAPLFPRRGQPALAPGRLAVVTLLQYAENLSDRQAADAVRGRIDWKYLLGLTLEDPGFDASVLSEFRSRLLAGGAEETLLNLLLEHCREQKLLQARGRQRTDSTHVLAAIRGINRVQCVGESVRHALNTLAILAPEWLRAHSAPEWVERYHPRVEQSHLPRNDAKRRAYAEEIGQDGHRLLEALDAPDAPAWLKQVPAIEVLRRIWIQQFYVEADRVRWRTAHEGIPPSSLFLSSPYDPDAHYARKYTTRWIGYKVHLTETCDDDLPRLITHVQTTGAPVADGDVLEPIHQALKEKDLLPGIHLADTGYVEAHHLVTSKQQHGVELVGPTRKDFHWQAQRQTGFAAHDFHIDWETQQATCPAGHTSLSWSPAVDRSQRPVVKIKFSMRDCGSCGFKSQCTQGVRRTVTLRSREQHLALEAARERERGAEYAAEYARRSGVEGTLSQAVRTMHLRRARYIGLRKTHLQHALTAAALNLVRISAWLAGERPARTRQSAFVRLMAQPAAA